MGRVICLTVNVAEFKSFHELKYRDRFKTVCRSTMYIKLEGNLCACVGSYGEIKFKRFNLDIKVKLC